VTSQAGFFHNCLTTTLGIPSDGAIMSLVMVVP
jgi:hypothetical protein